MMFDLNLSDFGIQEDISTLIDPEQYNNNNIAFQ